LGAGTECVYRRPLGATLQSVSAASTAQEGRVGNTEVVGREAGLCTDVSWCRAAARVQRCMDSTGSAWRDLDSTLCSGATLGVMLNIAAGSVPVWLALGGSDGDRGDQRRTRHHPRAGRIRPFGLSVVARVVLCTQMSRRRRRTATKVAAPIPLIISVPIAAYGAVLVPALVLPSPVEIGPVGTAAT